ncbi:MAG: hypothetical protein COA62_03450 [Rhodobiaceae bacterium]|nr:MAG: hypothetical protein COA62_03450 [Rhodobiaceae bacterium]
MRNQISVSVDRWAAWAPGIETRDEWKAWARGERVLGPPDAKPEVSFVKPMVRRRLSRLSRMSLEVAEACRIDEARPFYVFCSRYGEYNRTVEALRGMLRGEPMSPAAFSGSVHNTSAGHFTIIHKDRTSSTTVTAGEATFEAGVLEAWTALKNGKCTRALVVYHDEPLPTFYGNPSPELKAPLAIAISIRLPQPEECLSLSWQASSTAASTTNSTVDVEEEHPVLRVLRLLLGGSEAVAVKTRRLTWEWQRHVH